MALLHSWYSSLAQYVISICIKTIILVSIPIWHSFYALLSNSFMDDDLYEDLYLSGFIECF